MPSLSKPFRTLALTAFGALALFARAEDIDIFSGSAGGAAVPNILVIIDSSSNWSATLTTNTCNALNTKFGAEVCALQKVADGVGDKVRLGLMMFTESGDNGAYVRFGMRNMTDQNKTAFKALLGGLVPSGSGTDNSGSNQPYAKAMFEAFKYFGGYTNQAHATDDVAGSPIDRTHYGTTAFVGGNTNNTGTFRRDAPNNNTPSNRAASFYNADSNYAFTQSNNDVYTNPITDGCAKNFIIFISNGNPSTGGDSSTNPARDTAILSNLGVQQTCIPNCSNELHASKMDEMAKFLNTTDVNALPGQQKVITYTIAVYAPQASGQPSQSDQQMINLMQSAAAAGGGKYCAATTAAEVAACIFNAVNEVQAVNSVFVSASLPVSVNTQGTYLNQVYMGMFRPDATGNPRWLGNLKQYKISATAKGDLFLADSLGAEAINPGTGFVSPIAQSFWTAARASACG
jgi:type IV pilus assembly protein PilY1